MFGHSFVRTFGRSDVQTFGSLPKMIDTTAVAAEPVQDHTAVDISFIALEKMVFMIEIRMYDIQN